MKSYSIKLGEVNCQMLLLTLKNKGGELAIGFGNVKVIGNCVSSGFHHWFWRSLETCPAAQTY